MAVLFTLLAIWLWPDCVTLEGRSQVEFHLLPPEQFKLLEQPSVGKLRTSLEKAFENSD